MAQPIKNYRRFYAAFNRLPHYGDDDEQKEYFITTCTKGRTTHLHEMTQREYIDCCKMMENMLGYGEQRKRERSICLHLMQDLLIDTRDWQRINDFCRNPRIAGKEFAQLTIDELQALARKLRAIQRRGGIRGSEQRRAKSEESKGSSPSDTHHYQQIILSSYGTEQSKPS